MAREAGRSAAQRGVSTILRCAGINLAALAVVLGTGEFIVRLLPSRPMPTPWFEQVPGRAFRFVAPPRGPRGEVEFDNRVTLNRYGFHGPDHSPRRKPGVIRIALIGDSMVEGFHVPRDGTMAARMQAHLAESEVFGFGKSGHGVLRQGEILERVAAVLGPEDRGDLPEVAVFAIHGPYSVRQALLEVSGPTLPFGAEATAALGRLRSSSRLLETIRESLVLRLAAPAEEVLSEASRALVPGHSSPVLEDAWHEIGAAIRGLIRRSGSLGMEPVFAYIPDASEIPAPDGERNTDALREGFATIVRREGGRWLDITGEVRRAAVNDAGPLFFEYDQHLTARGHAFVGEHLAESLRPFLRK